MKKMVLLLVIILFGITARPQDTIYKSGFAVSYQPSLNVQFFGVGVYAHGLISGIIGFYGSLTGLYPKLPKDQPTPGPNDVQDGSTTGPKTYQNFSIGMTCKAVENFYFYAGFSLGDYKQNVVTLYRNSNGQFYNITTQTHGADRGFDFGAIYYAGKKVPRFGIQVGFNTTTKSIVGGIQIALFTRKVEW